MNEAQEKIRQLLREKRFDEARQFVAEANLPQQDAILKRIDELEQKVSNQPVLKENPKPAAPKLSNKPLPLSIEEERELERQINAGTVKLIKRPDNPQTILSYKVPWRGSAGFIAFFGGFQSAALANNFRKLGRFDLFVMSVAVYVILFVFQLFSFAFVIGLLFSGVPPVIIIFVILAIVPMAYPHILANYQQKFYEEWLVEHENNLRDYHQR